MSGVSPFLSYSTHENGATNNTLLLAKFIHERGLRRFRAFLDCIVKAEFEVPLGVQFSQQTRHSHSVPDGAIYQEPFKLLVETKLGPSNDIEQLLNHTRGMSREPGIKYLLWLLPDRVSLELETSAREQISKVDKAVRFAAVTFEDILEAARNEQCCPSHDEELQQRIDEYEEFCNSKQLLRRSGVWMRAVGCSETLSINRSYRLYFDQCRGFSPHDFVGAYGEKAVRGIGRVNRVVRCYEVNGSLENVTDSTDRPVSLNTEERDRILAAIRDARRDCGYSMIERHQFFLFDDWADANFPKKTKHPLRGAKFFNLTDYMSKDTVDSRATANIATDLSKCNWE